MVTPTKDRLCVFFTRINLCNYIYNSLPVIMDFQERRRVIPGSNCAGDSIIYRCSILSFTEDLNLVWQIGFPGSSVSVRRDRTTPIDNVEVFNTTISITLTNYTRNEYIESTIEFAVQMNDFPQRLPIYLNCGIEGSYSQLIPVPNYVLPNGKLNN